MSSRSFELLTDLKNDALTYILTYFCQKSGCGAPLPTPPSARFHCYYRPHKGGKSPASLWSTVWRGTSQDSSHFPFPGRGECKGWRFSIVPVLSFFLSGLLVLHRCGQVSNAGSLYSALLHHTLYPLHGPGSFHLDLVSLLLSVQKRGPTLSHPVCDKLRGSRFV
jgi:hypothetical protein